MLRKSKKEALPEFPFSLSLMIPGKKELTGSLADANMEGAAISFSLVECPDLKKDERVRLILTTVDTQTAMPIDALVTESRASSDTILYQFKFIDTTPILRDMDSMLLGYFNRRGAFRVRPDPIVPIEVDLVWENRIVKGTVLDISVTGLALAIESSDARQLEGAKRVTITFQALEYEESFEFIGNIVNLLPMQKGVRCSVQFNRKETEDMRKKERLLSKYITQRQLDMLKKRAGLQAISYKNTKRENPNTD